MPMMTIGDIQNVVALCHYPAYDIYVREDGRGAWYIQGEYVEEDIVTLKAEVQRTRRWFVSPEVTSGEVVQTCLKLVLTSAEHRVREHFLYKQRRVFGPHFDIEKLWAVCEDARMERDA